MLSLGYLEGTSNVILCNRCLNFHSLTIVSWIFLISINVITVYSNAEVKNLEQSLIPLFPSPHPHHSYHPVSPSANVLASTWKKYIPHLFAFFLFLAFSPQSKSLLPSVLMIAKVPHFVSLLLVLLYNPHKSQNTTLKTCHILVIFSLFVCVVDYQLLIFHSHKRSVEGRQSGAEIVASKIIWDSGFSTFYSSNSIVWCSFSHPRTAVEKAALTPKFKQQEGRREWKRACNFTLRKTSWKSQNTLLVVLHGLELCTWPYVSVREAKNCSLWAGQQVHR